MSFTYCGRQHLASPGGPFKATDWGPRNKILPVPDYSEQEVGTRAPRSSQCRNNSYKKIIETYSKTDFSCFSQVSF